MTAVPDPSAPTVYELERRVSRVERDIYGRLASIDAKLESSVSVRERLSAAEGQVGAHGKALQDLSRQQAKLEERRWHVWVAVGLALIAAALSLGSQLLFDGIG